MQAFNFVGVTNIAARGRKLQYVDTTAELLGLDPRIKIYGGNREIGVLYPGAELTLAASCDMWELRPYVDGQAVAGVVLVGDGEIRSPRMPLAMPVLDGAVKTAMLNRAFMAGTQRTGGAAAYSAVGVVNVGASGEISVRAIMVGATATGSAALVLAQGTPSAPVSTQACPCVHGGAAASTKAVLYSGDSNITPAAGGPDLAGLSGQVNLGLFRMAATPSRIELPVPIVLPPGWGLWVVSNAVATTTAGMFEVEEL